jgi:predicted dehydrogenase
MIKIAVLGAGRWGLHLVRNFWKHPQANLVAVVDPHPERLAFCREKLGLDDRVVLATAWSEILQSMDVEAVAIATPAATHYQLISTSLQQGLHVFAEKPLTLDPTQALELCRLAEQQQKQLFVDHTYLFHPAINCGKNIIKSNRLGELRYGYAARTHLGPVRQDVDALWDLAIHDIAIFNTWLGQIPQEVQAVGNAWLQQGQENSSPISDLVWVTLTYPNDFQAFIHLCWSNPDKQRRLSIVGSQGTLIFDELQPDAVLTIQHGHFQQTESQFTPVNQYREVLEIADTEPLGAACDRFLNCIQQNTPCEISSGLVGAQLVQILTCLSQSLQQGGQILTIPSPKSDKPSVTHRSRSVPEA